MSSPRLDLDGVLTFDADAIWLGWHAARIGVVDLARAYVPPNYRDRYDEGATLPDDLRVFAAGLSEADRKRLLRTLHAIGGPKKDEEAGPKPLAVSIVSIVQRQDIGTATRYDLELECAGRTAKIADLRASDLLAWERLRPIALDSCLVLPRLGKGQGDLWIAEVQRAMDGVRQVEQDPEDSEAMELRELLADITASARLWVPSEDEPYPVGVARIEYDGWTGWTRGPLIREARAHLCTVGRVALRRARESLGWRAAQWNIKIGSTGQEVYVRVWAIKDPSGD